LRSPRSFTAGEPIAIDVPTRITSDHQQFRGLRGIAGRVRPVVPPKFAVPVTKVTGGRDRAGAANPLAPRPLARRKCRYVRALASGSGACVS